MPLSSMDLKRKILQLDEEIMQLQKRNAELEAALYDETHGISGTLRRDENERINQKAADALALVDWWFSPPEAYCPKCAKADSLGHSVLMGKRDEMLAVVRGTLVAMREGGIVPAEPNPF